MAKKKEEKPGFTLPFQKINYILFGIALVVIAIGFYLQSIGPANSVESLTLAPHCIDHWLSGINARGHYVQTQRRLIFFPCIPGH
jgi:hypothetical protein